MQLLITCPYGLGSLLASELRKLGFHPEKTFQTGTFIMTDMQGMMRINLWSRIANKVFIQLAKGHTNSFDQLFELIKKSNYSQYLSNTNITLKVQTKQSQLSSLRSIQSVAHKAILESMNGFGRQEEQINELLLMIEHNQAQLYLNSSGHALYQRGYRMQTGIAPLKENIAVALLLLANRRFKSPLFDPFCGSGTIAIEGALLAKNIAPGTWRKFAFEQFKNFEGRTFETIKSEAKEKIFAGNYEIFASDFNEKMLEIAQENAAHCGVADLIHFEKKDFLKTDFSAGEKSRIVSNPPYGKRMESQDLDQVYERLVQCFEGVFFGGWISSYPMKGLEQEFRGEKKLFNGDEPCSFWRRKLG